MKNFIVLVVVSLGLTVSLSGQKVKWLTWEEALAKNQVEKRKFLVDVYTDWCGWCKKMEKNTFSTSVIADYVNANYYPVKFNAEQKEDIVFNNKIYKHVGGSGRKGYNELAREILRNKMSYPTVVFIDSNLDVIQPIPGYQDKANFEMIMTYFAEDYFQTMPWNQFVSNFSSISKAKKGILPKDHQPKVQTVGNR